MKSMNKLKRTVEIVCCYAHEDEAHLQELKKHLSPLLRQNKIRVWHDGDISAGALWDEEIKKHLNHADIILLLISSDFINSNYCYSTEMQHALERHKRGEASVIPIILRHVSDWEGVPPGDIQLGELRALPRNAWPVTSWTNPDEAWKDVARGIKEAINKSLSGVSVPPVSSGQEQASMQYLPIVSSPTKGAATLNGSTTQRDGWWGNRATRLVALAITLALVVSIAALVGNQVFNLSQDARSPNVTSTPTPASSGATITFDALGGSSNVIEVYPGVGNTLQDKTYNGTYYSGETVPIVCETKGRTVTSNPAAGEQYRQSDKWYKLQTPSGTQPEYATAVYADKHGSVPQC